MFFIIKLFYLFGLGIQFAKLPHDAGIRCNTLQLDASLLITRASGAAGSTSSSVLPLFFVQSHTNATHNADRQQSAFSFSTVPHELYDLSVIVEDMISNQTYDTVVFYLTPFT